MSFELVPLRGDCTAVPQLIFAKLPEAEDDWVRVALYVISTGETDAAALSRALRLKSPERAKEALLYWKGAGLLVRKEDALAETSPLQMRTPHLTTPQVSAAAVHDSAIAGLLQECQRLMGGIVTQSDCNIIASLYCNDNMPMDMILLGVAHFASLGKRSARYIERALLSWQQNGIDTGPGVERYLAHLAQCEAWETEVARLLSLTDAKFTKGERTLIAQWHEELGYEADMIAEAIAYSGDKANVRYVNAVLRGWYTKGYRTLRDVMRESSLIMQNTKTTGPTTAGTSVLGGGLKRAPSIKKFSQGVE